MIDAYVIGAKLNLDDRIFRQTSAVIERFIRIQQVIDQTNSALKDMGARARTAAAGVDALARSWERVATAANAASKVPMADRGGGRVAPMDGPRGPRIVAPIVPGGDGGRLPPGSDFYVGGDGPRRREYPLARRGEGAVATTGGGGQGGVPPMDLRFGERGGPESGRRGGKHDHMNDLFMGGMVAATAWRAAHYAWGQVSNPAHVRAQLMMLGYSSKQADTAMAKARNIQQTTPGITFGDAATALKDAYVITRSRREALALAPILARDSVVLHGANDTAGIQALFMAMASGEMKGALNKRLPNGDIDTRPMEQYLDLATRISVATGGRFSPQDFKRLASNAGPLFRMMNSQSLVEAAVLSMGLGASKTGTGINALGLQFLGGKMNEASAMLLEKLGLVDAKGAIHIPIGTWMLRPGAVKGQKEFAQDPFQWVENTMLPAIKKTYPKLWKSAGSVVSSKMSKEQQLTALYQLFSRIPGGKLAAEVMFSEPLLQKYMGAVKQTPGPKKSLDILSKNDPLNALEQFTAAIGGLMAAFAKPSVKDAVAALHELSGVANNLSNWSLKHPQASHAIGLAGAGAGGYGAYKAARAMWHYARKMLGSGDEGGAEADATFLEAGAIGECGLLASAALPAALIAAILHEIKRAADEESPGAKKFYDWINGGGSLPVHVTNGHDLSHGVTHHQARMAGSMPSGTASPNTSMAPPHPGRSVPGIVSP